MPATTAILAILAILFVATEAVDTPATAELTSFLVVD
jgi:hypothetical protein